MLSKTHRHIDNIDITSPNLYYLDIYGKTLLFARYKKDINFFNIYFLNFKAKCKVI